MRRLLILLTLLSGEICGHATTGAREHKDSLLLSRLSPLGSPLSLRYDNPALQTLRYGESLSTVSLGYDDRHEAQPLWVETGDGYRGGAFHASSYTRLNARSVVWGEASYTNGKRTNQQWSENADFDIIRPYVTADTIGGDMQTEQYTFRGGYAHQGSRLGYGVQLGYRSGMDYRDHDPRPKCTTLDVDLTAGLTYLLPSRWLIGAFAAVSKYNQQQSITFMNPRGVSMLYQMTGLGTHYFRFKGANANTRYDGSSWSLGLTACPASGQGLSLSASTRSFHLQKQLTDEHYLPLCDISEWHHQAELLWQQPRYYVRLAADLCHRTGTERIYDSGVSFYKEITRMKPLKDDTRQLTLEGATRWLPARKLTLELQPQLNLRHTRTTYEAPFRESAYTHLTGLVRLHAFWQHRAGLLSAQLCGGYQGRLDQQLTLTEPDTFLPPMASVEANHHAQSASCGLLGTSVRYDLAVSRFVGTLFLQADAAFQRYDREHTNRQLSLSVGVTL